MAQQGGNPEDRRRELVPGRHGGRIVRETPGDRGQRDHGGDRRRGGPRSDRIDHGDGGQRDTQDHQTQREKPDAAQPEGERMQVGEPPCVDLVEVAVRHLAAQYALGSQRQHPFVGRYPGAIREGHEIRRTERPDNDQ